MFDEGLAQTRAVMRESAFCELQRDMNHLVTKPTKCHVRQAKTQISVGSEDLSDWTDVCTVILLVLSWGGSNHED